VVGHGSREARANEGFEALVEGYRQHLADRDLEVAHGYVELARPTLDESLADLGRRHQRVVVVPLFLFMVGHTKNDIPIALARARTATPSTQIIATRELGIHGALVEIAFERAAAAMGALDEAARAKTALGVVGRGTSE